MAGKLYSAYDGDKKCTQNVIMETDNEETTCKK
jgi:hypothetical protein